MKNTGGGGRASTVLCTYDVKREFSIRQCYLREKCILPFALLNGQLGDKQGIQKHQVP